MQLQQMFVKIGMPLLRTRGVVLWKIQDLFTAGHTRGASAPENCGFFSSHLKSQLM